MTQNSSPAPAASHISGSAASGAALVILTLVSWSVTPVLISFFKDDVDAWTSNGIRYSFSALLWLPTLIWTWSRGKLPAGIWKRAFVPAMINAIAQIPFTVSLYIVEPELVAFGLRMQIVTAAIGAAILFPAERLIVKRPLFIIGIIAVISGTIANALLGAGGESATGVGLEGVPRWIGVLCAMAAGGGYACYSLGVRKNLPHDGAMISFAVISQYTAVVQLLAMFILGERGGLVVIDFATEQTPKFGLFLLSAIIGIALGHVLFYGAMKRLGVAAASGVIQLQPFAVAAISVPVFGKSLTPMQWVFGGVAVGGAMLMLLVQRLARGRVLKAVDGEAEPEAFEMVETPSDAEEVDKTSEK